MAKITYEDKVSLNVNPGIPNVYKVTSDNMNEIKSVVNANAVLTTLADIGLSTYTTLDDLVNAIPNDTTFSHYLSGANATTLYNGTGGTGNLPDKGAGLLVIRRQNNYWYVEYWVNENIVYYATKLTVWREWIVNRKKAYIKVTNSSGQALQSSPQTLINCNKLVITNDSDNDFFKINKGKIEIMSDEINTIRISGSIGVNDIAISGYFWGIAKVNSTQVSGQIAAAIGNDGMPYISASIPTTVARVNKGDLIALYCDSPVKGTSRTGEAITFLMVEVVDFK